MLNPCIFQCAHNLYYQAACCCHAYHLWEIFVAEIDSLRCGIYANTPHFMLFVAPSYILFPIGPGWIYRTKWNKHSFAVFTTFFCKPRVSYVNTFGEKSFVATTPHLRNPVPP